jgi:hypothetical protein
MARYWLLFVLAALLCWGLSVGGALAAKPCSNDRYDISVYYYPGWHTTVGRPLAVKSPWDPILAYSDRRPLLGWYKGDNAGVVARQMSWMCDYGIDNVVFDWYFDRDHTRLEEPLRAYLAATGRQPKFSLLWANHSQPTTSREWDNMIAFWADNYLSDPRFYSIDGRKVIFIFSLQKLSDDAQRDGGSLAAWLQRARDTVRARGLGDLYFVGGVKGADKVLQMATASGVDALSAYNYPAGPGDKVAAHGYQQLDSAYRRQWSWLSRSGQSPLIVPMTAGWDRRPWGGSPDPARDNSMATRQEFRDHLAAARAARDGSGVRRGVICCWNEYGEGSVIEPTRRRKFEMLEEIKRAFAH